MEISCETCKSNLIIPDEKLPQNKSVNIICPKCKDSIPIDTRAVPGLSQTNPIAELTDLEDEFEFAEEAFPEAEPEVHTMEMSIDELTGFLEEGGKRALVCDEDHSNQETFRSALKELGYSVSIGMDPRDVIKKLKVNRYDVIVLNDRFGGCSPSENPVLNHIQPMPTATRRNIFLALLGSQYRTLDNMTAFSKSANAVINQKDLPNITAILKKAISDNDKFYYVFKKALIDSGKQVGNNA